VPSISPLHFHCLVDPVVWIRHPRDWKKTKKRVRPTLDWMIEGRRFVNDQSSRHLEQVLEQETSLTANNGDDGDDLEERSKTQKEGTPQLQLLPLDIG
jgi:hypothetical protein